METDFSISARPSATAVWNSAEVGAGHIGLRYVATDGGAERGAGNSSRTCASDGHTVTLLTYPALAEAPSRVVIGEADMGTNPGNDKSYLRDEGACAALP